MYGGDGGGGKECLIFLLFIYNFQINAIVFCNTISLNNFPHVSKFVLLCCQTRLDEYLRSKFIDT